ncbi:hypothetical protein HUA74_03720 [Myxococcus sp. CA051A]|uniref:hypothetical protein n=1 Tax=unclassified Myxococcus TaxID=2648731 RepID=UPI00157A35B0|nr:MULTISPECIES: hypothetical protein [unclassified Myxococcus]NTX58860.1 hypothetical protein [Myxococcus sp. CA039A]NTX59762.1 hypothetical protein [Myxococcus sp. CA051A]
MRSILGGLLAAALLVGCGGGNEGGDEVPSPEGEVSAQAICESQYVIKYYDKTYTTVLGTMQCACGADPVFTGTLTPYPKRYNQGACP